MCYLLCLLVSVSMFVASIYCSYNNFRVVSDLSSPGSIIWNSFDEIFTYYYERKPLVFISSFEPSFSSLRK